MRPVDELLDRSASHHGHLCPGQILGVRMAVLGCSLLGIDDPESARDLLVYVEIDRCVTDAIQSVTGCRLGKRTLKHMDYGKVAATFVDLRSGAAYRVVARDDSRETALRHAPAGLSGKDAQTRGYRAMPDSELFTVTRVRVGFGEQDLPGKPVSRVACETCGEGVSDRREVVESGRTLCVACAQGAYYEPVDERDSAGRAPDLAVAVTPDRARPTHDGPGAPRSDGAV